MSIFLIFTLGITVDLWMPYMFKLVSMTLTLKQGHNGSAKATNQRCMLSETKQAISMKLATTVGYVLHDLDFANVYIYALTILFFSFRPTSILVRQTACLRTCEALCVSAFVRAFVRAYVRACVRVCVCVCVCVSCKSYVTKTIVRPFQLKHA